MSARELEFRQIHDAFRPKIRRYLTRLVGESDAEDLTQEVFVRVSRALPTFRGESQLSTWIYRIAANAATDKMRAASFRADAQKCSLDQVDESADIGMCARANAPALEQQLLRKERHACFCKFVGNLPANYQSVVALSELRQLTNKEIASVLGLPLNVVKIRLHRGRERLYQELQAHCQAEDWL